MKKQVCIIGAGGHCRPVINLLELCDYKVEGVYDRSFKGGTVEEINSYRVKGDIADAPRACAAVLAVGDNKQRELLYKELSQNVLNENLIHPKAIIENRCILGSSNQILGLAYINSDVSIGDNNILNTGCVIEHETKIGSHAHISVGAILCGRVKIGDRCFIGAGAVVIDGISICADVTIGANSVVVDDIKEPGTYAGCPARRLK